MVKLTHFEGKYNRQGLKLERGNIQFIIGLRKKTTEKKPQNYLLILEGKQRSYFSSLYPTSIEGNYFAEYQGIRYDIVMNDSEAIIKKVAL